VTDDSDRPPVDRGEASEQPTSGPVGDGAHTRGAHGEAGGRIGPFRLVSRLGAGGMGEVWLAEQTEPLRRRVALKLIRAGMDTREVVARFEAERQTLAILDHPNVARVYEAGETARGRPYFVMEYVAGEPITAYCDHRRVPLRDRLELFVHVCEGVQHAHQRAIIHRDLKPSNVLVTEQDGRPVPKIIDFGIAKATAQRLTAATLFTHAGQIVGTPAYMSPEQADETSEDIDTRTDVYSLGVLLYELLVGALPLEPDELRAAGLQEMRRRIREVEPSRPSARLATLDPGVSSAAAWDRGLEVESLRRVVAGDLDWITMKALEKDRARRYDAPRDLAADLARYLDDLPVLAGPPSLTYRARKFARRNRRRLQGVAAAVVALAGIAAVWSVRARQTEMAFQRFSQDISSVHGKIEGVQAIALAFGEPVFVEGYACTALATLLDDIAPLGDGRENVAPWFADFSGQSGARASEYVAAQERARAWVREMDERGTPVPHRERPAFRFDDPLVREAEGRLESGVLRFYEDVYEIDAWKTPLPNLLMAIQLGKLWIARADREPDFPVALEDYRRAIRIGRLLRREDVILITGWTGLQVVQDGLEALSRRQRAVGDTAGADRTGVALAALMAERLEMVRVFDVLNIQDDVLRRWWQLKVRVPGWKVDEVRDLARAHPSRAVRIEAQMALAILSNFADDDAREAASRTLDELVEDADPLVAKFAASHRERASEMMGSDELGFGD